MDIILTGRTADILRAGRPAARRSRRAWRSPTPRRSWRSATTPPRPSSRRRTPPDRGTEPAAGRTGGRLRFRRLHRGAARRRHAGGQAHPRASAGRRIAPTIPTTTGQAVLIDCGANAECTREYLLQFAYLGSYYAQRVLGVVQAPGGTSEHRCRAEQGRHPPP